MDIFSKLNQVTNKMATELELIRRGMTGRGVSPDKSPMIEMRLQEIEQKLKMIGSNPDNAIPFN